MTKRLRILTLVSILVVSLVILAGCNLGGCEHEGGNATCTEQAVCEKCGVAYGDVLGHDIVEDAAKAPDCTNTGLEAGQHCTRCDYKVGGEVVDALGHTWVDATCTTAKHCSTCEVEEGTANGHSYNEGVVTTNPTCTEKGVKTFTCTVEGCGDSYTEEVAATNHHYESSVTAPTCTTEGYTTHTCSCGDSYVDTKVNATGHKWNEGVVTTAPTCTEKGVKTFTCTVEGCGETHTEDIKANGHTIVNHNAQAATCENIGWNAYETCEHCDYTTYSELAKLAHQGGEWIVDKAATLLEAGSKHRECTVCGATIETAEIPQLTDCEHTNMVAGEVTAPTCTAEGYTTYTCAAEGCNHTEKRDYVQANGHSFTVDVEKVDATCTVNGYEIKKCANCEETETKTIASQGHTYESVVTAPTCEVQGYTTHTCSCGDSYVDSTVDAKGHDYASEVTTAPTCTEKGVRTYTCKHDASHTYTEDIGATGHTFEKGDVTAPTCTDAGYTTYTCSCGESEKRDTVASTGHSYSSVVTAPTCTADGYTTYTCGNCNDTYTADETDATGHTEPDADGLCGVCDRPLTNEAVLKALYALESGESLDGKYTLTGVIIKIDTAYNSSYENVTVTIVVDGLTEYPVVCFRMKGTGADVIAVGDTITVTGTLKNYNGTKEYDSSCTLDSYTEGHTCVGEYACSEGCLYCNAAVTPTENHSYDENGICQCGAATHTHVDADLDFDCDVEGCDETVIPADGTTLTIEQALKLGELYKNNTGATYTDGWYYVSGILGDITNTKYGTSTITDGTYTINVYGLKDSDGTNRYDAMEVKPVKGDTVTLYGQIGAYYEKVQMNNSNVTAHTPHTCDWSEATCKELATCTICGATTGDLAEHNYVDSVCTVCGATEGVTRTTVTVSIADYASTNGWSNGTQYSTIIMDDNITVTATGSSYTGKYYTSGTNWRIYQNESPSVTVTAAEGKKIVSVKITYTVNNTGVLTLNGENIASGTEVTVNANTITFGVGNTASATNGQVRITSIEVVYQ